MKPIETHSRTKGQASMEVVVVTLLLALALVLGPNSPIERLFRAVFVYHAGYTAAISRP